MLIGNKVYLRALQDSDINQTIKWRNSIEIKSRACSHPFPITLEQEKSWYSEMLSTINRNKIYFAICRIEDNSMLGYVFLDQIDWINRHCFWGGIIGDSENQKKGFGSEAVMLIIKYAFENLNMRIVYANVLSTNIALHTWLRSGATIQGTLTEHVWQNGVYQDLFVLAWFRGHIEELDD